MAYLNPKPKKVKKKKLTQVSQSKVRYFSFVNMLLTSSNFHENAGDCSVPSPSSLDSSGGEADRRVRHPQRWDAAEQRAFVKGGTRDWKSKIS